MQVHGIFLKKLKALAKVCTVPGKSMYGEAVNELKRDGINDAIPFMGSPAKGMVKAANDAVDVAGEDLPLEIAIITGARDVSDGEQDNGYSDDDVGSVIESSAGVISEAVVEARDGGVPEERLPEVVEAVSDTLSNAVEDMAVSQLSSDEIVQVVETIGQVYTDAIKETAGDPEIMEAVASGDLDIGDVIIASIGDQSKYIDDTVKSEMEVAASGEETSIELLTKLTARKPNKPAADETEKKTAKSEETPKSAQSASDAPVVTAGAAAIATPVPENQPSAVVASTPSEGSSDTPSDSGSSGSSGSPSSGTPSNGGNPNNNQYGGMTVDPNITGGVVKPDQSNNAPVQGDTVTLNITPNRGHSLDHITINKVDDSGNVIGTVPTTEVDPGKKYTFDMPDTKVVVEASFTPNTYNINLDLDGAVVNSGNVTQYTFGTAVTLPTDVTKAEDTDYRYTFDGFYDAPTGGNRITAIGTNEIDDKTYYARFTTTKKVKGVTLAGTASVVKGQTITLDASITPADAANKDASWSVIGATDIVTLTPNTSNKLQASVKGLKDGTTTVRVTTADGTFTADCVVTVTLPTFTPSVPSNIPGGSITVSPTTYTEGQTVTINVTPDTGKEIDTIAVNNVNTDGTTGSAVTLTTVTPGTEYQFTAPENEVKISATFKNSTYPVTLYTDATTVYTNTEYTFGTGLTLPTSAVRSDDATYRYTFAGWFTDPTGGSQVTAIGSSETGAKEFYAHWTTEKIVTGVTWAASTPNTVEKGSSISVTAVVSPTDAANTAVTFESSNINIATVTWSGLTATVTGTGVGTADITVKTVDGNKTATLNVTVTDPAAVPHSVTIGTITGGTVVADKTSAVKGETVTLTVTPSTGQALDKLEVKASDGRTVSLTKKSESEYTFRAPESDVTVTATFYTAASAHSVTVGMVPYGCNIELEKGKYDKDETVAVTVKLQTGVELTELGYVDKTTYDNNPINPTLTDITTVDASGKYTFTMPDEDIVICAVCKELYALNMNYLAAGGSVTASVNGSTVTSATDGDTVTLVLQPAAGYSFMANDPDSLTVKYTYWDGSIIDVTLSQITQLGDQYTCSFTMLYYDVSITAVFISNSSIEYGVGIDPTQTANGTITADKEDAKAGEIVTLTATPDSGYALDHVTVTTAGGTPVAVSDQLSFAMPAENVTVTGVFARLYDVSCVAGIGGNLDIWDDKAIPGAHNEFRIMVEDGYELDDFLVKDDSGSSIAVTFVEEGDMSGMPVMPPATPQSYHYYIYSFTMPESNVTISASFVGKSFGISSLYSSDGTSFGTATTYGTVAVSIGGSAASIGRKGDSVTLTVAPANGRYCESVTVEDSNGALVQLTNVSANVWSFTMPSSDVTIKAVFRETFSLTAEVYFVDAGGNETKDTTGTYGTASLNMTSGIDPSVPVTLTTSAVSGYYCDSYEFTSGSDPSTWIGTRSGKITSASQSLNINTTLGAHQTVKVYVKESPARTYSVAILSSISQSVSTDKTSARAGETVTLTVTPVPGYYCETIELFDENHNIIATVFDGVLKSGTVSFTMPAADVGVTATFESCYQITTDYNPGGGTVVVDDYAAKGENVSVTATPNSGYILKSLKYSYEERTFIGINGKTGQPEYDYRTVEKDISVSGGAGSFTMPESDVTVTAEFESTSTTAYPVNIDTTNITNGTVTSSVSESVPGKKVLLTVTPEPGYALKELTVKDEAGTELIVSAITGPSGENYMFYMPDGNAEITALFEVLYSITYDLHKNSQSESKVYGVSSALAGSTVTPSVYEEMWLTNTKYDRLKQLKISYVENGSTVTQEITPNNGTYSFVMPEADVTVIAYFDFMYRVRVDIVGSGTYTQDKIEVAQDEYINYTITPDVGYVLQKVTYQVRGDGFSGKPSPWGSEYERSPAKNTDGTYSFTYQLSYCSSNYRPYIKLHFVKETFAVTVSDTITGGTVAPSETSAEAGSTVTLTVTPDSGNTLKKLSVTDVDGTPVSVHYESTGYTFTMPSKAVNVSAEFVGNGSVGAATGDDPSGWFSGSNSGKSIVEVSSDVTLTGDLVIPSGMTLNINSGKTVTVPGGKTLTIESGALLNNYGTLTIESGATFTNNGTYNNYSDHTLNNYGKIVNTGTLVNGDGVANDGRINNFEGAVIENSGKIVNNEGSVVNNEGEIDGNNITGSGKLNDPADAVKDSKAEKAADDKEKPAEKDESGKKKEETAPATEKAPGSEKKESETPAPQSEVKPSDPAENKPSENTETKPADPADTKPAEGSETKPAEGAETKPADGSDTKPSDNTETKPDEGKDTKPSEGDNKPKDTEKSDETGKNGD